MDRTACPTCRRRGPLLRFLSQFHNVLIYVLLGAAVVTGALQHWVDTGVILAVVLANAVIGFIQEGKAEAAMAAIRGMLAPRAAVLRDGARVTVDGADLVPGDIVLLEAGDKVPADLRVIEARGLAAQEAILTGESVPVEKGSTPVAAAAAVGDRRSMLWSGTLITQGTARGLVVATGTGTEIGRIGGLLAGIEQLTTPLVAQMDHFARWLSFFILFAAGLLLVYGYYVGHHDFAEMFMAVVGVAVAAIPEGLPAVMTITLAIGVQEMARRNAIVRRLPAIEAIGSVSVICTDKTGTLTRNEMVVTAAETAEGVFAVTGEGYAPEGAITPTGDLIRLARAAALCNDAILQDRAGHWTVEGDPMEGALLAFAGKVAGEIAAERLDAIPFDSRHRFMAVLTDAAAGRMIHVKGAPERVMPMCGNIDVHHWHARANALARQGLRVLALAERAEAADRIDPAELEGGLTFLGLVGLIDPPRPEAIAAIAECRAASIRVKMITGDHAGTATAIAAQIGLQNPHRVLTGADLDELDDAQLALEVADVDVFARASPEHKLRLVTALQANGLSVAMTGDGVNDAPALKRADAGIAMGLKGSEAAKEAAVLVLADDNFASIVAAVREGRTVFDNLRKVISFELPTSAGEAMVVVLALLLSLSLPITPVQILWINLITGITLGHSARLRADRAGNDDPPATPAQRTDPVGRASLACRAGGAAVPGRGLRYLHLCHRHGISAGAGADHGDEHDGRARDLPSVLHPQHLRHLADLGGGARYPGGMDGGHRHRRRAIRGHVSAAPSGGAGHKARAADRRATDRGHRYRLLRHRRDRKTDQARSEGMNCARAEFPLKALGRAWACRRRLGRGETATVQDIAQHSRAQDSHMTS